MVGEVMLESNRRRLNGGKEQAMHVGIAGVGRMGAAIAARLLEVGHQVTVWNRTRAKVAPLAAAGAEVADTPRDLAARVGAAITILGNPAALSTVYEGPHGMLHADVGGTLFIEMSTVAPEVETALADKVRARGGRYLECPVGGTVGPAREGKLLGVAGGAVADFALAKPLLHQLCRRVEHVGPIGAGSSMKLAINLPLMVYYQALGESYVLCRHLGLDPGWLMELLAETSGAANVLKAHGGKIAAALAGGDAGPAAFDVDLLRKDLAIVVAEGNSRGATLPLAQATLAIFDAAARDGWGRRDSAALPAYWPWRNRGGSRS
jgi:3-hydroxyisobutyrate dehydrogenase